MASKVQKHCIKIAMKTGNTKTAVYIALLSNIENNNEVYLDNAKALCNEYGITARQFAGYLAALAAEGKYKQIDGTFGQMMQTKE